MGVALAIVTESNVICISWMDLILWSALCGCPVVSSQPADPQRVHAVGSSGGAAWTGHGCSVLAAIYRCSSALLRTLDHGYR